MNVLVITGDKTFKPGHPRYDLQRSAVDRLEVVYWGRESPWPNIPDEKFDVVTSQDPFMRGLFAWRVARRMGTRFNVQVHADLDGQSWWKRLLARVVLKKADSIRVVSQKVKEQVERLGGRNITVLPVYVDVSRFSTLVRRPHERKSILWIGRYEEEKDPLAAISTLEEVRKTGMDAVLTMIGRGKMQEEVIKRANNLPIIDVLGWKDPYIYLGTADVVLCTSLYESWGASIVEALAAGLPVVAPDVGIAKEAGAIVVPREQLADKVIEVLRSGVRGHLELPVLTKEEWVQKWKKSLI